MKYISFSDVLLQEIAEGLLFFDYEKRFVFDNYRFIVNLIKEEFAELIKDLKLDDDKIKECWKILISRIYRDINDKSQSDLWEKFDAYLESASSLKDRILDRGVGEDLFMQFLQDCGILVRLNGSVLYLLLDEKIKPPVYALPFRINSMIKFYRHYKVKKYNRFVIEAFRNPFEVEFFRQRYYEFYLFSIFAPLNERKKRLPNIDLAKRDVIDQGYEYVKDKEEPELKRLKERFKDVLSPCGYMEIQLELSMQNTSKTVELSDININNTNSIDELYRKLLFYYALILHPGFVPPTNDETLMNMAYMLSLLSTCISRQVGAIIVEDNGYIVGAGWNDVSDGQIGCGLRWREDCKFLDNNMLPLHTSQEQKFRAKIIEGGSHDESFCFKDEYADIKGKDKSLQYCRALHAEENAILQTAKIGGMGLKDTSTIYTTTFPCELCAKKIYQVGINRVVYVEPYPKSISEEVFFKDGIKKLKIEQFEGVKPHNYFRLYKPSFNKKEWQKYIQHADLRKFLLS